ncbi:MAG: class I SAM-dependent methyltransferase [Alphaproteobacteria bacterium]|nr:class I SAM-dependent methyltransferase [Alphaproteobacteria bacterium]
MPDSSLIERAFSAERAEVYDAQFLALRAIKDALHLLLRIHLSGLPDDARILVAGAGTGAEVRFLAPLFPGWRFTLVDPAEGMLAVARRHANAEGFAERCAFHAGYLESAPDGLHDAAISVLASQFLTDVRERQAFFEEIAARLVSGGLLFNADLSADLAAPTFETVMDLWLRMLEHAGPVDRAAYRGIFGRMVAAHGPAEVERILAAAGFPEPALCYQMALIRGWIAARAAPQG